MSSNKKDGSAVSEIFDLSCFGDKVLEMAVTKPEENKYIYTDGVDYSKTPDSSVWGTEEETTLEILKATNIRGDWLNLCAGDGRFNNRLLTKADKVIAADIDSSALEKLIRITPKDLKNKLEIKIMNVVEPFPFEDESFDGIFCVGTLHLFPRDIFKKILNEMSRVLKSGGMIIIDFAADIKRTFSDGKLWIVENEPNYSLSEAQEFLAESFKDFQTKMEFGKSEPEVVNLNDKTYTFTCNFVVLTAVKK